jgi:uncharacterized protein YndB with AHSA1/START domain
MTTPMELPGAVDRRLGTTVREGRELRRLTLSRRYPTTADDLWQALTDPERIPRWFLPVTGDTGVGGRFQVVGNACGEVLACDPPRSFQITWEYDAHISWVTVTLTPAGDATGFVLEHDAPVDPERWATYGPGAVGLGWELGLLGLLQHLETGTAVDPQAFGAWMATPEALVFMTGCSDAWVEARVAAGDDPEESRAAGARCTAAYTGQE